MRGCDNVSNSEFMSTQIIFIIVKAQVQLNKWGMQMWIHEYVGVIK